MGWRKEIRLYLEIRRGECGGEGDLYLLWMSWTGGMFDLIWFSGRKWFVVEVGSDFRLQGWGGRSEWWWGFEKVESGRTGNSWRRFDSKSLFRSLVKKFNDVEIVRPNGRRVVGFKLSRERLLSTIAGDGLRSAPSWKAGCMIAWELSWRGMTRNVAERGMTGKEKAAAK
jgi:hypothetical protein